MKHKKKSRKIRVLVLFGGKSAEHEISLQSAKNVVNSIDKDKYEVVLMGIDKKGQWRLSGGSSLLLKSGNQKAMELDKQGESIALVPGNQERQLVGISEEGAVGEIDVVFPVLHGTFGEDGTVQGLLKLANIPFVGASVLGSAIGMDKDVQKRLLRDAKIPVAKFIVLNDPKETSYEKIVKEVGLPFFIKPANLGSSVGVHKVKSKQELSAALKDAFSYDRKVLVEEFIKGRELECAVLGNEKPIASVPGEVIPQREFYSYEAKYIDEHDAVLEIPAKVSAKTIKRIQELAVKSFQVLYCEGMARVDFFLKENGEVLLNEINTIPGFTKISMYPKLWEASGVSYEKLIDALIQLAIKRFEKEQQLKTSFLK
jgi:D-alanine-D-alanine ligase